MRQTNKPDIGTLAIHGRELAAISDKCGNRHTLYAFGGTYYVHRTYQELPDLVFRASDVMAADMIDVADRQADAEEARA